MMGIITWLFSSIKDIIYSLFQKYRARSATWTLYRCCCCLLIYQNNVMVPLREIRCTKAPCLPLKMKKKNQELGRRVHSFIFPFVSSYNTFRGLLKRIKVYKLLIDAIQYKTSNRILPPPPGIVPYVERNLHET